MRNTGSTRSVYFSQWKHLRIVSTFTRQARDKGPKKKNNYFFSMLDENRQQSSYLINRTYLKIFCEKQKSRRTSLYLLVLQLVVKYWWQNKCNRISVDGK